MGFLKDQLRVQHLWLEHPDQKAFLNSRLRIKNSYLVWRLLWAFYHSCWLVTGLVVTYLDTDKDLDIWFIYLSHWVYLLLTLTCLIDAAVVVMAHLKSGTSKDLEALSSSSKPQALPWYLKMKWCMSNVVSTGCIMVTLWYWLTEAKGKAVTAVRLHYHGVNAFYVILNLGISKMPIRLFHCVYPVCFGVLYTAFTAVYFSCGGTNQNGEEFIYKAIDWSRPKRTFVLSSLSNFVFIPLVHGFLWGVSIAVGKLYARYYHLPQRHQQIEELSCSESVE